MLRGNCATIVWAQLETPGCRALVRPQSLCVRWRWRGDGPERCPKSDCARAGNCKTPPSIWMRYAQREGAIAAAFEIPSRNVGRSTWVCEGQWRGVRETGVADSELGSQQMPDGLSDCNLPKGERGSVPPNPRGSSASRGISQGIGTGRCTYYRSPGVASGECCRVAAWETCGAGERVRAGGEVWRRQVTESRVW